MAEYPSNVNIHMDGLFIYVGTMFEEVPEIGMNITLTLLGEEHQFTVEDVFEDEMDTRGRRCFQVDLPDMPQDDAFVEKCKQDPNWGVMQEFRVHKKKPVRH